MAQQVAHSAAKIAVFLHSGDYDRVHQGLAIAAAAVAVGRPVEVFFFWWALERLAKGQLDDPELPGRPDVEHALESRGHPSLRTLIDHLRESGLCTTFACTGSLSALGLNPDSVESKVDQLVGWTTILARTAGVTDRFYL